MDAGVLRMLNVAGLIDRAKLEQLLKACGFPKLKTTLTGNNSQVKGFMPPQRIPNALS
jgi:hypothetical protein